MTAHDVVAEVKGRIGWRDEPRIQVIHGGDVERFCDSIGDPSPRWKTEVPPTYLLAVGWHGAFEKITEATAYGTTWLNAGDRFTYARPVTVGMELRSQTELVEVDLKHGRTGDLLMLVFETRYEDTTGDLVATHRAVRLRR